MKKLLATLAVITLVACGGEVKPSEVKSDSVEVKKDSVKIDSVGKE